MTNRIVFPIVLLFAIPIMSLAQIQNIQTSNPPFQPPGQNNIFGIGNSWDRPISESRKRASIFSGDSLPDWAATYESYELYPGPSLPLSIDNSGNIYVACRRSNREQGDRFFLLKYNPDGEELWSREFDSAFKHGLTVDNVLTDKYRNVYVVGTAGALLKAVKYNPEGDLLWETTTVDSSFYILEAVASTLDDSNNLYITGSAFDEQYENDIVTKKYNPEGLEQWSASYVQTHSKSGVPIDLGIDAIGNIYIGGWWSGRTITLKYDTEGNEEWRKVYNGIDHNGVYQPVMAVTPLGNVYLATSNSNNLIVLKYNADGVLKWTGVQEDSLRYAVLVKSIQVDASGNSYVAGNAYYHSVNSRSNVVKFNNAGSIQWVQDYQNTQKSLLQQNMSVILEVAATTLDARENLYATGIGSFAETGVDMVTTKYNAAGERQWSKRYNTLESRCQDFPRSIAVDPAGNIVLTGIFDNAYKQGIVTIKYTARENTTNPEIMSGFKVIQNYPNPFNNLTILRYQIPKKTHVRFVVYNIRGRQVAKLVDAVQPAGLYAVPFLGKELPSGIYIAQLSAGKVAKSRKFTLLK